MAHGFWCVESSTAVCWRSVFAAFAPAPYPAPDHGAARPAPSHGATATPIFQHAIEPIFLTHRPAWQAEVVTGTHRGDIVFIPRIQLSPDQGHFPFEWSRRQFPVRVAFAMTINKAQGQTLERVGVYLCNKCFAHGQLYVAVSRVGHPSHLRFAVKPDADGNFRATNIVYDEVLT